jgi:DNA modification methylase
MINKLILGDNLEILKSLESESVDLYYLDPIKRLSKGYQKAIKKLSKSNQKAIKRLSKGSEGFFFYLTINKTLTFFNYFYHKKSHNMTRLPLAETATMNKNKDKKQKEK